MKSKQQNKIAWAIIVIVVFAMATLSVLSWYSGWHKTAGWKTYTNEQWHLSFKYPSNWRVIPKYSYSPAGAGGLVGYIITPSTSDNPSDNARIDLGGAQVDCQHLVSQDGMKHSQDALCETNLPIYTFSKDSNVMSVFHNIASSLTEGVQKKETPHVASIQPIPGWQTYVDSKDQRFSIEYPADWHTTGLNDQDQVTFCAKSDANCDTNAVIVSVYTRGDGMDELNNWRQQGADYSEKQITVFGYPATQRQESYCNGVPLLTNGVFVSGSKYDFQIQGPMSQCGSKMGGQNYQDAEVIFNKMLSTFTEGVVANNQNPTTSWKTFSNSKAWFTFNYPGTWADPAVKLGYGKSVKVTFGDTVTIGYDGGSPDLYINGKNSDLQGIEHIRKDIMVDGRKGVEFATTNVSGKSSYQSYDVFINDADNQGFAFISIDDKSFDAKAMDHLLSTFTFTAMHVAPNPTSQGAIDCSNDDIHYVAACMGANLLSGNCSASATTLELKTVGGECRIVVRDQGKVIDCPISSFLPLDAWRKNYSNTPSSQMAGEIFGEVLQSVGQGYQNPKNACTVTNVSN